MNVSDPLVESAFCTLSWVTASCCFTCAKKRQLFTCSLAHRWYIIVMWINPDTRATFSVRNHWFPQDLFTPKQWHIPFSSGRQKMQLFNGVFACTYYIKYLRKLSQKNTGIAIANLAVLMWDTYSLPVFEEQFCFSHFSLLTESWKEEQKSATAQVESQLRKLSRDTKSLVNRSLTRKKSTPRSVKQLLLLQLQFLRKGLQQKPSSNKTSLNHTNDAKTLIIWGKSVFCKANSTKARTTVVYFSLFTLRFHSMLANMVNNILQV